MKHSLIGLGLMMAIPFSTAMAADIYRLLSPGAVCQPAKPQYAEFIDYLDGTATAHADIVVSCALPAVPPGHVQIGASVTLVDVYRRWGKQACRAFNLYGTEAGEAAIVPIPGHEHLAKAVLPIDPYEGPIPHAVVCDVRAGQQLYGIQLEVVSLF